MRVLPWRGVVVRATPPDTREIYEGVAALETPSSELLADAISDPAARKAAG